MDLNLDKCIALINDASQSAVKDEHTKSAQYLQVVAGFTLIGYQEANIHTMGWARTCAVIQRWPTEFCAHFLFW